MNRREAIQKNKWFFYITTAAFCFSTAAGEWGYALARDSQEYIDMQPTLPPLYPIFLYIMRVICGTADYLQAAVWVQCVLWAVSVAIVIEYVTKRFQLPRWTNLLFFAALVLPMSRGDSQPWYFGTHAILTEGLSFAFFHIYFVVLLKSMLEEKERAACCLWVWTGILILTRDQFLLCLGLSMCVWIYRVWRFRLKKRRILIGIIMMMTTYLACNAVQDIYKLSTSGNTVNIWNSTSALTHTLYGCDEKDSVRLREEERELFEKLFMSLDSIKYNYKYAEGSIYQKGEYYSEGFNPAYNLVQGILDNELSSGKGKEKVSESIDCMIVSLFPAVIKWFVLSLQQLPKSLANSIFFVRPPYEFQCIVMAGILYLGALLLLGWTVWKQRWNDSVIFMGVVLGFILVNSIMTEFAMRSIARYLSYTMGLFYIAGFILVWHIGKGWRE